MSLSINGKYDEELNIWGFDIAGEIDISNAQQLKLRLEEAYAEHPTNFSLNLERLSYIDSTGLGVFIGIYGTIRDKGHKIVIVNPRDNVKKLLRITSLDKVLTEK